MIKRNKIAGIFSIVITLILLCASVFVPINKTGESVVAEGGGNVLYAFVSKQGTNVNGRKIYVDFGLSVDFANDNVVTRSDAEEMVKSNIAPFEYAKIYLRTRNLSAIAEKGDYEAVNQTVTVYGHNPYTSVAVTVNKDGLHINRSELSPEDTLRSFYLEIYKVEVVGLKDGYTFIAPNTTPSISSEKLTVGADISIRAEQMESADDYNLGRLIDITHYGRYYSYQDVSAVESGSINNIVFDLANQKNDWFKAIKYMSERDMLKLGINVSGTGYEEANSYYVDNSYLGIQVFAGDPEYTNVPALEDVPDELTKTNNSVTELARWFIKFQSDYEESLALDNAYNGKFEGVTVNTQFNEGVLLYGKLSMSDYGQGGRYDAFVEKGNPNVFVIEDLEKTLNGGSVIATRVWSYLSNKKTKAYKPDISFLPVNYRAKVTSATIGQAYYDEQGHVKLGVSLRFSEPMQLKQYLDGREVKPSITGYLNRNAVNELDFDYVMGDGTDTYYFEADLTEYDYDMHITSVTLDKANGFDSIYDFAPITYNVYGEAQDFNLMLDTNKVNGWDDIAIESLPCSYDLRTPEIDVNGNIPQAVKTSHTTTVRTGYISETGMLHYGWTDNDQSVPKNLSKVPISSQGFQTISSPSNVTGAKYLYVVAVSDFGKKSQEKWIGPFNFDNEAPILSVDCTKNTYKEKQFNISITNNLIEGFTKFSNLKETVKVVVSSDAKGENSIKEFSIPLTSENLGAETVTIENFTLTAQMLDLLEGYGTYYVTFSISDVLENRGVSNTGSYYFDVRDVFNVTNVKADGDPDFEMDEFTADVSGKLVLEENYYTLDLSKKSADKGLYFKFKAGDNTVVSLSVEEFKKVSTGVSVLSAISSTSSNGVVTVTVKEKFAPGLYSLVLKDTNSEKRSLPIYFYVTNGKSGGLYQEETGGYQSIIKNEAFTNRVFQIPTSVPYYNLTNTGTVRTKSYSNTNKPATFSSWASASSYILYNEYLDLYAVTLTQSLANDLNSGIYRKADGVDRKAEAGQVWIRYKEVNWSPNPNSTTNNWVYYYYAEDKSALPINIDALSNELQIALNTVVGKICSNGTEVDLVTEENLDKYGAPMLSHDQMHIQQESSKVSMSGTAFASSVEYLGDLGMHLSLDPDAPLSTNALFQPSGNRRFYYKTEGSAYHLLTKDNRETFGEYFDATGKFTILELDENGAREYTIYIDKTAPSATISWTTQNGTQSKEFSKADDGQTISGNNFFIKNIADYDTMSFVSVYRYTSQGEGDLLDVYRKSDFENGQGIRLEDGKYHVFVADRSGNSYSFVLQMKSEPLVCTVKEVDNSYIRVDVNRSDTEVRYQVYLDGLLLTTNFDDKRFTEGGQYRFLIEDIYGNVYDETHNFERDIPTATWRYQTSDGSYALYEGDNERISIQKTDNQNFVIATSTYLRFLPLDGCAYEIISGTPNPSENMTTGWVTLNNMTAFTMKIYYEMHPETYVIYTCTVDNSAPQVSVSYEKGYYQAFELDEIKEKLDKGEFKLGDNPFTPSSIGFASQEQMSTALYVSNGQRVQSKYFKVQASDESGVKELKVYLEGELILTRESDFSNIYLSRRGTYQIVATDNFGNVNTFTFSNEYEELVEYFVDGEKLSTDVSFADNFAEKVYTKAEYGKSQTEIRLLSSVEVHYIITDSKGNPYYFAFVVEDGVMYTYQYVVKIVDGEYGVEIENIYSRGVNALTSGVVAKIDNIGVAIYLSKNGEGVFKLTVSSTDREKKAYTVETRISSLENQNEMPYYFKTELSTIPSSIEFIDEDGNLIAASQTIKVNKSFAVREGTIAADIESVEVSFSRAGNYTTYETVYDGTYRQMVFENEGMYHVKVVNRYGIQTDYYVVISSQFVMSATVEYIDGTTMEYSTNYTKEQNDFYSNKSVEFIVYATNIKVLDKDEAISILPSEQGYTTIYINTQGAYLLKVEDEYGNRLEKNIFIEANTLTLDENILTNFNEKALRRDENYTNQKVLINKNAVNVSEIAFIGMNYGDRMITIYDNVSEVKTAFDESQFIGALGDGEYTLIFRDYYGNKAETVIHYCGTSTLTILRNTLNGVGVETYSLEEMLSSGVWTNDSVDFSISASEYVLKVDGMENVKSIDYDTKTKNEYDVYYLDEYGFEYTFKVYLHREDVVIQPAESMSVSQLSDLLVTKDSVQMRFTENALCSYTLNNEPEKVYNAGDILYKDGIYRFKTVDKAGNVSTYTVKKDSAVEYRLEGTGTNEILVNGGVTNSHSVKFFAENADNAYIKKVFHNNEFIEYEDEIFTERGKWELIVADDAGNESYFRFYILNGKIDGFSYNTPYNYVITSVVWKIEDSIADAAETIKEQGLRLEATENGKYTVTMQSSVTGDVKTFAFTIDKTPPQTELLGCQPNEKTINNVTLKGCSLGDTIYVYKDGKLVKTVRIDSDYMDPPTISEAGKYKIIVENEAGIQTELSFERKYIPNVAGSVLIIVLAFASVLGLFVGLIWRNHSKTDD